MTFSEIARHRIINQQLAGTTLKTAAEMVAWLGAIQAQEYSPSKWAIGLRLPHLTDAAVEAELTAGSILRTHLLRPTWHFVTAEDVRWMLQLTAPRVQAINAFMYRQTKLDATIFKRCHKLIIQSLQGNNLLTRDDLKEVFNRNRILTDTVRLSCILMHAELEGLICSGPRRGKQSTYALLEERVAPMPGKTHDEALFELTNRYFTSRGPATAKDFATWSGLTLADCKKGIAMLELKEDQMNNETFYWTEHTIHKKAMQQMQLLPIYDELIMGYKDREAILQYSKHTTGKQGFVFDNTILFKGQIIGTWKRTLHPKLVELTYQFFKLPTTAETTAFKKSIAKFETFTGLYVHYKQQDHSK